MKKKVRNILSYFLSKSFDSAEKFDSEFLSDISKKDFRFSYLKNKSAAIILSNLSEFYHNMRDYRRSQIGFNLSNLYFEKYDKEDPLFYRNYSFIVLNNFKITNLVKFFLQYL